MSILPSVLDGMNLPEPVKAMIKSAIPTSSSSGTTTNSS